MNDRLVLRPELLAIFGASSESLRRWLRDKKVPAPDVRVSQRTVAWRASTLRAAGIAVPAYPPQMKHRSATREEA